MTRDDVELDALSNESYLEEIGPQVDKLLTIVRLSLLCSEIEGGEGKLSENKMFRMGNRNI